MAQEKSSYKLITIALALVIFSAAITILYVNLPSNGENNDTTDGNDQPPEEPEVILSISFGSQTYNYTITDLEDLEEYEGSGSYVKTKLLPDTVIIDGPYNFTGVKLSTLISEINNLPENYNITVVSLDGWTSEFTKDNISGKIDVYNETGVVISDSGATMILAYKEDNEYITDEEIGPLRVAFVGDDVVTASNLWAKMVESIEIVEV